MLVKSSLTKTVLTLVETTTDIGSVQFSKPLSRPKFALFLWQLQMWLFTIFWRGPVTQGSWSLVPSVTSSLGVFGGSLGGRSTSTLLFTPFFNKIRSAVTSKCQRKFGFSLTPQGTISVSITGLLLTSQKKTRQWTVSISTHTPFIEVFRALLSSSLPSTNT